MPRYVIVSFEPGSGAEFDGVRFTGLQHSAIDGVNNILDGVPITEIRGLLSRQDAHFLKSLEDQAASAHPEREFDLSSHFVIEFSGDHDGRTTADLLRKETIVQRAEISRVYPPPDITAACNHADRS